MILSPGVSPCLAPSAAPRPTPPRFTDASVWVRALSIPEREPRARSAPLPPRWLRQPPYSSPDVLPRRLAAAGLDADAFGRLVALSRPPVDPPAPDWAHRLDALLDDEPAPDAAGGRAEPPPGLGAIARPFVDDARRRARAALRAAGHGDAADRRLELLVPSLVGRATERAARTLVLELNVARVRGELHGDTGAARWADFCRRLDAPATRRAILAEYVVLARGLLDLADAWVEAACELLDRLAADAAPIRDALLDGVEPGEPVAIRAAGDLHAGGRCVAIVTFASGARLVYKPRSLAVDVAFHDAARWLVARGFAPTLHPLPVLDRGAYGWAAFADHRDCADADAVGRYYERLGGYLALLHVLEATDMHLENLVAHGEQPILVDLEAVLHPRLPGFPLGATAASPAASVLRESVMRVGLLPAWVLRPGARDASEVSGIGGAAGQLSPDEVPVYADAGTDAMRIERRRVPLAGAANQPRLAGAPVGPARFGDRLADGFARAYDVLAAHRDELLAPGGVLDAFARCATRAVVRDTRHYALTLVEATHPDHLRDAAERDRLLDGLWQATALRPHLARVVAAEQAELRRGDVPLFRSRPDSTSLWTAAGDEIADVVEETPLAVARRRVASLDARDRDRQAAIVRTTVATLAMSRAGTASAPAEVAPVPGGLRLAPWPPESPPATRARRWLAVADAALAALLDSALTTDDVPDDAGWLGAALLREDAWTIAPLGADLYDGRAGVALFLAYAGALRRVPAATALAERVARGLLRETADRVGPPRGGAFGTLGGVAYLLAHLGTLWRRPDLHRRAVDVVARLGDAAHDDADLDVVAGSAGTILVLRAVAAVAPDPALDAAIRRCADRLVATAERIAGGGVGWRSRIAAERPLLGFSHGASGIAVALAAAAVHTGDVRYARIAIEALAYERRCHDRARRNWPDFRERAAAPADGGPGLLAWCHGAPGIALARVVLRERGWTDAAVARDLADAVAGARRGLGTNHSLCHGDLGNLDALARTVAHPGGIGRDELAAHEDAVLDDVGRRGVLCGAPQGLPVPGLMMGIAGVGLGALRLVAPRRVPSVLALDPPPARYRS